MVDYYRKIERSVTISADKRSTVDLQVDVWSADANITKFILKLDTADSTAIDLTDATVTTALVYDGVILQDNGQVEEVATQLISYVLNERLRGYEGVVNGGFYVTLKTGQKIDIQNVSFNMRKSLIDTDLEPAKENYYQTFDDIVADVQSEGEKAKTQIANVLPNVQAEIAELQSDLNEIKSDVVSIDNLNTNLKDLELYVGYTKSDVYGVEIDMVNKTFKRLGASVGKNAGADFDNINAFKRRRCNVTDTGVVLAYYGDSNYTESGLTTVEITKNSVKYPANTPVQVMVEQPKFYYKVVPLTVEQIADGKGYHMRKGRYYISDYPKAGFKIHPAFIVNGAVKDKIYLSAYEGCIYDVSTNSYVLNDEQIADFDNDMLSSIAGAKPVSGLTQNLTRANVRKLAQKRGAGWQQAYAATISATQLLFLVEYAKFNMQDVLGPGAVDKTDDSISNLAEPTGATTTLGNQSGHVTNSNNIQMISYRGEENLYGNIWKFIDGINVKANGIHAVYVADHDFNDKQSTGAYEDCGFNLAKTSGYVSAFGYSPEFDWLFLTSETTGNSSVPVGDYFYQDHTATNDGGWCIARTSANWLNGGRAGGYIWATDAYSYSRSRDLSGRLVFNG